MILLTGILNLFMKPLSGRPQSKLFLDWWNIYINNLLLGCLMKGQGTCV